MMFSHIALLSLGAQTAMACDLSKRTLRPLWTSFPPLIMPSNRNNSESVTGALYVGLTSMLQVCCHPDVTLTWDTVAWNVRHLESTFGEEHDLALPVTRSLLVQTVGTLASTWSYIPLLETPGELASHVAYLFGIRWQIFRNLCFLSELFHFPVVSSFGHVSFVVGYL